MEIAIGVFLVIFAALFIAIRSVGLSIRFGEWFWRNHRNRNKRK